MAQPLDRRAYGARTVLPSIELQSRPAEAHGDRSQHLSVNSGAPPPIPEATGIEGRWTITEFELRCFSQHGEDGVIAELLARVGIAARFFIEFGVETGREGNCVFLADVLGWEGLFIEPDEGAYPGLAAKYATAEGIRTVNAAVTPDNVEELFAQASVPLEPDVLSIDVDGEDYWIWEAIEAYRPRVVVIEYNAVLPPGRQLVQPLGHPEAWDGTDYFGASLDALTALADRKGYRLAHTDLAAINAFFVRNDLAGEAAPARTRWRAGTNRTTSCRAITIPPIRITDRMPTSRRASQATRGPVRSPASSLHRARNRSPASWR